jgi:phosphatidylglycerophosphatase A
MFTFLKLKILYKSLAAYFKIARGKYSWPQMFLSFGGVGYLRPASGTWGSLAALPFGVLIHLFFGPWVLLAVAAILYAAAVPIIWWFEKKGGEHDASWIVIDEVIGMFIALVPATLSFTSCAVAFVAFRAFDALKPGPIGWLDQHMPGAHGVLLDDVLAGVAAALLVLLLGLVV